MTNPKRKTPLEWLLTGFFKFDVAPLEIEPCVESADNQ